MAAALQRGLACLCLALAWGAHAASSTADDQIDTSSAANLMVVLRESPGDNKQDEALQPYGRLEGRTADGRPVRLETSWYRYLGDMHIRLVFEGRRTLQSASPDDLARLHLTPDQALDVAVSNLRRVYGSPTVRSWSGGLMQVQSPAPEFTSSYFLDRDFWTRLQAPFPAGLVVAVPRRGEVVYAAAADDDAVSNLRFGVAALYAGGPGARLSSALYLFKNGHWSVYQPAQPAAD